MPQPDGQIIAMVHSKAQALCYRIPEFIRSDTLEAMLHKLFPPQVHYPLKRPQYRAARPPKT